MKLPSYTSYGEGNKSRLNTSHNTDIEAIFPFHFVFIGSLIVSASEDPVGHAIPRQNISSCIWVTIPVDSVILHWYACGAHGRTDVQSCDYKSSMR